MMFIVYSASIIMFLLPCGTAGGSSNNTKMAVFTTAPGSKEPTNPSDSTAAMDCARECARDNSRCSWLRVNPEAGKVCNLNDCDRNASSFTFWKNVEKVPFLRRQDGSVDFNRNWADYKSGFGDPEREFWMGLDKLHQITSSQNYGLLVELLDNGDLCRFAAYDRIVVGNESDRYRLSVSGFQSHSTAGDSIIIKHGYGPMNGKQFATKDNDPVGVGCGTLYKGGWWYADCYDTCGTCLYDALDSFNEGGVHWYSAMNDWTSFNYTEWSLVKF